MKRFKKFLVVKNKIIYSGFIYVIIVSSLTVTGAKITANEDNYKNSEIVLENPVNFNEVTQDESKERARIERVHAGKVKQMEIILESLNNIKDNTDEEENEIEQRARNRHFTELTEVNNKEVSNKTVEVKNVTDENNIFTITAYDLSYNSCEKTLDNPGYGVTASGYSLKGMDKDQAMTVAADTSIIPMGSRIRLEFEDDSYQKFNGIYTVRDRGGAIKGAKLDLFMGDFNKHETDQSVWDFGRVKAKVYLIK